MIQVQPLTKANFFAALASKYRTQKQVEQHRRATYLFDYLVSVGARTMVVESDYTDADFLDDYTSYYARSFEEYPRKCSRLHFFEPAFDDVAFRGLLLGASSAQLESSYRGFVVVRPLPEAIIGRTVVATYPDDGGRRLYSCTTQYTAHLAGVSLPIKSLPFQEQDTVLAACATVALWSAFHRTRVLFGTIAPSPAQITTLAHKAGFDSRPVPSHHLSLRQMCTAVREVGLEPEVFTAKPTLPLVMVAQAYLRYGLPVVFLAGWESVGGHAITLVGYSKRPAQQLPYEVTRGQGQVRHSSLRIDEFFGHDDQLGPFAKMPLKARTDVPAFNETAVYINSDYLDPQTGNPLKLLPQALLVPVYHKIRLTPLDIQEWLLRFDTLLASWFQDVKDFEWDLYLTDTNQVKQQLRDSVGLPERDRLLLTQMPRFLWRADLSLMGVPLATFLFDATGISRSFPGFALLSHDDGFRAAFKAVLQLATNRPVLEGYLGPQFLDFLILQVG